MKIVHIVGTGTIGEPLIGLFLRHKKDWGIDEVTFHKNTPLKHDVARVKQLVNAGGILCTDKDKFTGFYTLGLNPVYKRAESLDRADVVIDCTPVGNENKNKYYFPISRYYEGGKNKLFIAQGSEEGFGTPFATGINEAALKDDQFIQVVSCNTHNISVLLKTFQEYGKILASDFVCMRRASDISQDEDMTPSIEISKHKSHADVGGCCGICWEPHYGTHHAYDVCRLFKTVGEELPVFSSAAKFNSQYMHCIRFRIDVDSDFDVIKAIKDNPRIATTHFKTANRVFSFGRDYGHYGRILNQAVVVLPSLESWLVKYPLDPNKTFKRIVGFCFTPQDGNSLISSVAATLWHLHGRDWDKVENYMKVLEPYIFKEI